MQCIEPIPLIPVTMSVISQADISIAYLTQRLATISKSYISLYHWQPCGSYYRTNRPSSRFHSYGLLHFVHSHLEKRRHCLLRLYTWLCLGIVIWLPINDKQLLLRVATYKLNAIDFQTSVFFISYDRDSVTVSDRSIYAAATSTSMIFTQLLEFIS